MKIRHFFRLLGFECRKTFWKPSMLLFFGVLVLMNGWKIHDSYVGEVARWEDYTLQYQQTYETYSGQLTRDKVSQLVTVYRPLESKAQAAALSYEYDPQALTWSEAMDYDFYSSLFYTEIKYDYLYQNYAYTISSTAEQLVSFHDRLGNSFESAKNQRISRSFAGRKITAFYDTRGYEVLLNYDYSSMLILLFSIFALSGMFVTERETDMFLLLRTTKNGAGSTVGAKLTAAGLFILGLCCIFFLQDFLTIYLLSPSPEILQNPVYSLRALENTPFTMTLGQYFLWSAAVKTLGIGVFCICLLLISSLLHTALGSFLTGFFCCLGLTTLQAFSGSSLAFRIWNPLELIFPRELIQRDVYVNLFGFPVRLYGVILAGVLALAAAMICLILRYNRSYHNRRDRRGAHVSI